MDLETLSENLIEDEVVEKSILPDLVSAVVSNKLGFDVEVKGVDEEETE